MGEIRINQQIKLFFTISDGVEKELNCSVKKFEEDRISLNFPEETMEYIDYLHEGVEVLAKVFGSGGVKVFDSIILNSPIEDEFVIEFSGHLTEVQRRMFIRENYEAKVIIERKNHQNIVTQTIDIGGGGIRFFYDGEFIENETVNMLLYLPIQTKSVQAEAAVLKKDYLPKGQHVLLFNKITEMDRSKIINFCYGIQIKKLEV